MPRLPRVWKDPERPRRGMSPFMIFSNETRDKVKADNPGLKFGDIARELARQWTALPFEQKDYYGRLSEADRARYEREVKDYVPPPVPKDKIRKFRDPSKPKRCMSAFMFFSNEMRDKVKADNPGLKFGDVARELARIWKEAPPEVQAKYNAIAEADKRRYSEAMLSYRPPPPAAVDGRRRKKKEATVGEPRKPRTPFMMFCQIERPSLRESNPGTRQADLTSALSERWRSMSEEEKSPYVNLSNEDRRRYEADLEAYRAYAASSAAGRSVPVNVEDVRVGVVSEGSGSEDEHAYAHPHVYPHAVRHYESLYHPADVIAGAGAAVYARDYDESDSESEGDDEFEDEVHMHNAMQHAYAAAQQGV